MELLDYIREPRPYQDAIFHAVDKHKEIQLTKKQSSSKERQNAVISTIERTLFSTMACHFPPELKAMYDGLSSLDKNLKKFCRIVRQKGIELGDILRTMEQKALNGEYDLKVATPLASAPDDAQGKAGFTARQKTDLFPSVAVPELQRLDPMFFEPIMSVPDLDEPVLAQQAVQTYVGLEDQSAGSCEEEPCTYLNHAEPEPFDSFTFDLSDECLMLYP